MLPKRLPLGIENIFTLLSILEAAKKRPHGLNCKQGMLWPIPEILILYDSFLIKISFKSHNDIFFELEPTASILTLSFMNISMLHVELSSIISYLLSKISLAI